MNEEHDSLILNKTWSYLDRRDVQNDANVISCKWVYRIKENNKDDSLHFKARLVFRGFEQTDCGETFAPVPKMATIRMLFAFAVVHDWDIWQMDVVTTFLHHMIDEDVYMELPEGYGIPEDEGGNSGSNSGGGNSSILPGECRKKYICKLNKALYGLKEAPRAWYTVIDEFLTCGLKLKCSVYDANLYIMKDLFLLLWVDDIMIFTLRCTINMATPVSHVKSQLSAKYRM